MSYILPNKNELKTNFKNCNNWEEKYLYIIELGNKIPMLSKKQHSFKNFISGCQSNVWVSFVINKNKNVEFKGDSNSAIVKGLLTMIFIFYKKKTCYEIIHFDIRLCFKKLSFDKYLTISRIQGIDTIIKTIKKKLIKFVF
ncbi:cysteine desulfuration protein SufE [Enterobacteriaceae endosymbiont of Donacia semicuprea]|uniref:cysteine desulfuration protein SufE n=1 Tax=Enterobacteriaceae endosymbiont of Donacia semicuprea TaxID=2675783 RepID=UPI001449AD94|nr:cysteine desulfuration protein SufE [Enterobacteriaceae endosymbiont of Donacia semicuprea]QJC33001.1 cysteine desulfuration protein SufE [Enterobacteriaceae endosymbiont of Donacia semicuprea]